MAALTGRSDPPSPDRGLPRFCARWLPVGAQPADPAVGADPGCWAGAPRRRLGWRKCGVTPGERPVPAPRHLRRLAPSIAGPESHPLSLFRAIYRHSDMSTNLRIESSTSALTRASSSRQLGLVSLSTNLLVDSSTLLPRVRPGRDAVGRLGAILTPPLPLGAAVVRGPRGRSRWSRTDHPGWAARKPHPISGHAESPDRSARPQIDGPRQIISREPGRQG